MFIIRALRKMQMIRVNFACERFVNARWLMPIFKIRKKTHNQFRFQRTKYARNIFDYIQ